MRACSKDIFKIEGCVCLLAKMALFISFGVGILEE